MCAAAFLQNREEDEGRRLGDTHWVARVVYALGASIFNLCDRIGQGESYAALTAPAIRVFGGRDPEEMAGMAQALGAGGEPGTPEAVARLGDAVERFFAGLGLRTRLRDYGVPRDLLPAALDFSMRNYNADRDRQFLDEAGALARTLELSW